MDAAADSVDELLGGALRGRRRRARGFAPWSPRPEALATLDSVNAVLAEYADYLPLTIRQVFYRLVGAHGYEKTEAAYERLSEIINRARRARMIDMDNIRDGGGAHRRPDVWDSADHFLNSVRLMAKLVRCDRLAGQRTRLAVFCEAAGMVPQLAAVAHEFGVPVFSSGGFESVTEKHAFAVEVADDERPCEVLHIGDHDPSGAHLFLALAEDVEAFADELGGHATFTRLAVTPGQITALRLPTAPAKATDRRAFAGATCQAEAIAPDVLAGIVRDAIVNRIDQAALDRVLKREKRIRSELSRRLGAP